jgi:hypothetical protein
MMCRVTTFCAAVVCLGCGGGGSGAHPPGRPLPPYGGRDAVLFDDGIEPTAVGYPTADATSPLRDDLLRERTELGDAVVRARVTTVTSRQQDRGRSWQLGFHALERLAGRGPLDTDFTLQVDAADPAAGIVRAYENRLVGKTFVVFVRAFARPGADAEGDLHYHIAADEKDELDAVRTAVLLEQVR